MCTNIIEELLYTFGQSTQDETEAEENKDEDKGNDDEDKGPEHGANMPEDDPDTGGVDPELHQPQDDQESGSVDKPILPSNKFKLSYDSTVALNRTLLYKINNFKHVHTFFVLSSRRNSLHQHQSNRHSLISLLLRHQSNQKSSNHQKQRVLTTLSKLHSIWTFPNTSRYKIYLFSF